ncbi:uncharacterized protein METZ01_LOCUS235945, partial [marine metagenome]
MLQVRIHGRGGQGVVSAAEMLSVSAFLEGKHAQAVPSFGTELYSPFSSQWIDPQLGV